jgi:hypothetical protein
LKGRRSTKVQVCFDLYDSTGILTQGRMNPVRITGIIKTEYHGPFYSRQDEELGLGGSQTEPKAVIQIQRKAGRGHCQI